MQAFTSDPDGTSQVQFRKRDTSPRTNHPVPRQSGTTLLRALEIALGSGLDDRESANYLASKGALRQDGRPFEEEDVARLVRDHRLSRASPVTVQVILREGKTSKTPLFVEYLTPWRKPPG